MLTCIKDNLGNIICACEWRKVNPQGQFDNNGKYIWIHTVEVSKPYQNTGILKKIIKAIISEMPDFEYAYFRREKYGLRIKGYTREQWLNIIKENKYEYAIA